MCLACRLTLTLTLILPLTPNQVVRFGQPCGVKSVCIYGGVSKKEQVQALRRAPEVIVATPGRLGDMLQSKKTKLDNCTYFVRPKPR